MEFRVLGPLEVVREGRPLDLGGAKQRAVLAALIARAGQVVTADRLADDVWEGEPPPAVASTLRAYLSNLRKVLEPDRKSGAASQLLPIRPQGYTLDIQNEALDAQRFEALASEGSGAIAKGETRRAAELIEHALALWRGRAFEDFAHASFAQTEVTRLEELRLRCIEDLVEARIELGQHTDVTAELETLTAEHPLRERLWGARMIALYRCGRQGDALKAYEDARRVLAEDLGIDPSHELRKLHESILRQDEDLSASGKAPLPGTHRQTVSFLFTDVELSTEMLLESRDEYAYAELIDEHRSLLRSAFEQHGGQRIATWGDAFFAAFDTASDALRAALTAQFALRSEERSKDVRVRMGIHTGEAACVGEEYVGISVHAAARIGDAAHGGQVLISQSTKDLLHADIGENIAFLDIGSHQLKDIPEPVHLYQVVHPELPKQFPAPRTLSGLPHNLPAHATSFVGRERDVSETADALGHARVVTLTGIGGVGKTRLSIESASEVLGRYPDGAWMCELAAIADADGIIHTIARALGVDRQAGLPLRESLVAYLRRQRTLLVLDNCEHVLEPVAEIVEEIVRGCAGVSILATSREGLGVDGEHIRPVRSLTVPDEASTDESEQTESIRLFVDRARAVRPDFEIGAHNDQAVAEICRRLDGIPLAIELAAARVATMGPLEIAARLDQRFRFLRSGRRTAVERHRTLKAAIDWSYALLSPGEQLLLDRLSVFSGSFTVDACERVCGAGLGADVGDMLGDLILKSIVTADLAAGETRYSLLETVRQYAQDKLIERGEEDALSRAHAEYFTEFAERAAPNLQGPGEIEWVGRYESEFDNLRAAHRYAITVNDVGLALRLVAGVAWYGGLRMVTEVEETWTSQALALPDATTNELFPLVLGWAADARWTRGELEKARELAERALELAPRRDDCRRLSALSSLAAVSMIEGRLDHARELCDELVELARGCGEGLLEAQWLVNRGFIAALGGDVTTGLRLIERAKPVVDALGSPSISAHVQYVTGEVLGDSDPERAIACYEHAIAKGRHTHRFLLGIALIGATSLRGRHGDPNVALRAYPEVIDHWRRAGMWTQLWIALRNLVELFGRIRADEPAVVLLAAADASPTATGVYGAQEERLTKLIRTVKRRLGAQAYASAWERGRRMTEDDAVAFALREIDAALELSWEPTHE